MRKDKLSVLVGYVLLKLQHVYLVCSFDSVLQGSREFEEVVKAEYDDINRSANTRDF